MIRLGFHLKILIHTCILVSSILGVPFSPPTVDDWFAEGQKELNNALNRKFNTNIAKNVIIFIGDGLDISTTTASRIYAGQKRGNSGEEFKLNYETFPNVALSKTYNTNRQGPDSAGTATAILCGVKAAAGTLGVNQNVNRGDCSTLEQNKVDSIVYQSYQEGKSTGLVTTARVTHATPGAGYAHSPDRDFEATVEEISVPVIEQEKCADIAQQLVRENAYINVILGGGRRSFFPMGTADVEEPTKFSRRKDNLDLVEEWKQDKENKNVNYEYVWNRTLFDNVSPSTEYLLGLFNYGHMQFELDRDDDAGGEPSIAEMTQKAIQILSKNTKGYFLMVEGARIDHAHHDSTAQKALADTVAFDDAVKMALDMTEDKDTLIVVTADHGHVFTMGGYSQRGNPILDFVDQNNDYEIPEDDMPYLSLMYANGPGYVSPRTNLTNTNIKDKNFVNPSAVGMPQETHSGQDVAIYARGPMSHLFHGTHEQNYIAHVMMYASCVGSNGKNCQTNGALRFHQNFSTLLVVILVLTRQLEV